MYSFSSRASGLIIAKAADALLLGGRKPAYAYNRPMDTSIKTFTLAQLEALMADWGQPAFRSKQLYEWLHTHHVGAYDQMTNLPKSLRQKLEQEYPLAGLALADQQVSRDGTRKYVFTLADGVQVETVGIPSDPRDEEAGRLTVCVSTQAGCPMQCAFCATGHEGLSRSLASDEIVDQVHAVQSDFGRRVSNVVAMGQGEPFLNYDATLAAMRKLNEKQGLNIGARHIAVSTCGLIDGIKRLAAEPEQFTLAVSLHSAVQPIRDALMPKVASQPLGMLRETLLRYVDTTGRRVTLEHLLIKDVNDSNDDLAALIDFCRGMICHVNLLPMNPVPGTSLDGASQQRLKEWRDVLEARHIDASIRLSHGSDIAGACGQLKNSL